MIRKAYPICTCLVLLGTVRKYGVRSTTLFKKFVEKKQGLYKQTLAVEKVLVTGTHASGTVKRAHKVTYLYGADMGVDGIHSLIWVDAVIGPIRVFFCGRCLVA